MNQSQMEYAIKMESERQYEKGCKLLGLTEKKLTVLFTIKGVKAGVAHINLGVVDFNIKMALANGNKFLFDTPAHEVAHILARQKYGNIQPHGREWKHVMILLGRTPERCHDMIVPERRKSKKYVYTCNCDSYDLSSKRHNKCVKYKNIGLDIYSCKKCRTPVIYTGKTVDK